MSKWFWHYIFMVRKKNTQVVEDLCSKFHHIVWVGPLLQLPCEYINFKYLNSYLEHHSYRLKMCVATIAPSLLMWHRSLLTTHHPYDRTFPSANYPLPPSKHMLVHTTFIMCKCLLRAPQKPSTAPGGCCPLATCLYLDIHTYDHGWVWIKTCHAPNIPPTTFAPFPSNSLESHTPSSVVYWVTPPHVSFYRSKTHFAHCTSCEGIGNIGGNDIFLYILIVVVPFPLTHDFGVNMLVIIRAKFLNWLSLNPSKRGYALNLGIYGIRCTTYKHYSAIIEVLLRYLQYWIRKHPFWHCVL